MLKSCVEAFHCKGVLQGCGINQVHSRIDRQFNVQGVGCHEIPAMAPQETPQSSCNGLPTALAPSVFIASVEAPPTQDSHA